MRYPPRRVTLLLLIVLFALAALLFPEHLYREIVPAGPNPFL